MTTDRWRRIEGLYHDMLARPPNERAAALVAACPDDAELQAEVQSLLDQPGSAAGFLATPALDVAAQDVSSAGSQLTGRRLGVFELQGLLGVGGMGEVYRARDTRLGRDVAIKILPRAVQDDPDRLTRFEREAKTLASLNHPHIAAIYGLERLRPHLSEDRESERRCRRQFAAGVPPPPTASASLAGARLKLRASESGGPRRQWKSAAR